MPRPAHGPKPPTGYPPCALPDGSKARGRPLPPPPYTRPGRTGQPATAPTGPTRGHRREPATRDYLVQTKTQRADGTVAWLDYTAHFDRLEAEGQRALLAREGELARVVFAPPRPLDADDLDHRSDYHHGGAW